MILGPKARVKREKPVMNHKQARIAAFKAAQRKAGTLKSGKAAKPARTVSAPSVGSVVKVKPAVREPAKYQAARSIAEPVTVTMAVMLTCPACKREKSMPKGQTECGACRNAR